jgi:hypothetical protein
MKDARCLAIFNGDWFGCRLVTNRHASKGNWWDNDILIVEADDRKNLGSCLCTHTRGGSG